MSPWTGPSAVLASRIRAFVDGSLAGAPPEPFERLALDIHRWQARESPVIAALVEGEVTEWWDIPAVPVALFRDLPVGTVPQGEEGAVFRTSGTTGGRGAHRMRSTALYDHNALAWADRCVPDLPGETVALLSDPAAAPDSSLSHMVLRQTERAGGHASWHLVDGVLQRDSLDRRIRAAGGPVYLATTAFAVAEWLEQEVPTLPEGSVCMVTGGFKGRASSFDDTTLYASITRALRPARLVTEYGMTELSSQLWGTPGEPYRPPPWLRAVAVDPTSGRRLPTGARGQLRFYDLCNLDATIGVETLDEGVVLPDGSVRLAGRLADAPPRGCSLTVEEAWARR